MRIVPLNKLHSSKLLLLYCHDKQQDKMANKLYTCILCTCRCTCKCTYMSIIHACMNQPGGTMNTWTTLTKGPLSSWWIRCWNLPQIPCGTSRSKCTLPIHTPPPHILIKIPLWGSSLILHPHQQFLPSSCTCSFVRVPGLEPFSCLACFNECISTVVDLSTNDTSFIRDLWRDG